MAFAIKYLKQTENKNAQFVVFNYITFKNYIENDFQRTVVSTNFTNF